MLQQTYETVLDSKSLLPPQHRNRGTSERCPRGPAHIPFAVAAWLRDHDDRASSTDIFSHRPDRSLLTRTRPPALLPFLTHHYNGFCSTTVERFPRCRPSADHSLQWPPLLLHRQDPGMPHLLS